MSNSRHLSVEERLASGKKLREKVTRTSHAHWAASRSRPDPIELWKKSDSGRLPALLPIRYARMRQSPFAFLRGAAALMAFDLASTPVTGIRSQACGDCHVANFGGFATPERRLIFDIDDFDETLPAPWEWDIKRLAASIVLAMRDGRFGEDRCAEVVRASVESYRKRMHAYAGMPSLEVWYSRLDVKLLAENASSSRDRRHWLKIIKQAEGRTSGHEFPKMTALRNGRPRIVDQQPLIYHTREVGMNEQVRQMFRRYRDTLPYERRVVLDRYELTDVARKVVGVGAVGTRCAVVLLVAESNDPLFLQCKEARASVLEPYASKSIFNNQGERVVVGQRMMQSASDVFLGWTRDEKGHDYYFRQLRDWKMTIDIGAMSKSDWFEYVELCGWALARAHARSEIQRGLRAILGRATHLMKPSRHLPLGMRIKPNGIMRRS